MRRDKFKVKVIKIIIFFILLLSPCVSYADEVNFVWDANTEYDLAGYRVYVKQEGSDYQLISDIESNEVTLDINENTYVAITAYDKNFNESGMSQEWFYEKDAPEMPKGLKVKIIVNVGVSTDTE